MQMKKVLIYCEKKFKDALFVNSPLLEGRNYYTITDKEFEKITINNQITILDKRQKKISDTTETFDIIIIDDLLNYEVANTNSIYYFIPPIDFNISDPFISDRWAKALLDYKHPNKVAWANTYYPNLKFLGSNIFESPNQIFDLSLVLNLNNFSENWGIYHFAARDLYKAVYRKLYKIDYCFREVKKENRVKFFLNLLDNLEEKHLNQIKISAHGGFLENETYYNDVRDFFEKQNLLSLFLEFEKIDRKFFSFDYLLHPTAGYNSWATNKLFLNTFSSDIAVYYETAREKEGILNTMNFLITEKTIDLLNIGKPFMHLSENVDIFLKTYGFKSYNELIFDKIADTKIDVIKKITEMQNPSYERTLNQLTEIANENIGILDGYFKNNTFLFNLIHN